MAGSRPSNILLALVPRLSLLSKHEVRIARLPPPDGHGRRGLRRGARAHEPRPVLDGGGQLLPAEPELRIERRTEAEGALRPTSASELPPRPLSYRRCGWSRLPPMLELRGIVPGTSGRYPTAASAASRSWAATACAARPSGGARAARRRGRARSGTRPEPRGAIDLTLDFEVSEHTDSELAASIPHRPRVQGTRITSDDQLFNRILQRSLTTSSCCAGARRPVVLRRRCPGSRRCSAATA
jgi:hypothetical protein